MNRSPDSDPEIFEDPRFSDPDELETYDVPDKDYQLPSVDVTLPDWSQGACNGVDPEFFFPARGAQLQNKAAKEICRTCVIREPCLDWAIKTKQRIGVMGGMSERQRRAIRKEKHAEKRRENKAQNSSIPVEDVDMWFSLDEIINNGSIPTKF